MPRRKTKGGAKLAGGDQGRGWLKYSKEKDKAEASVARLTRTGRLSVVALNTTGATNNRVKGLLIPPVNHSKV